MTASHYAEAFHPIPGRCFRFIGAHGIGDQPVHCPQSPAWRETFVAADGPLPG
ncbi:MAG TPA: hypothetical protein VG276_12305 [Actinomycetes bacterium]|nr:hypothetical protein [Actinomycetes bacterium]